MKKQTLKHSLSALAIALSAFTGLASTNAMAETNLNNGGAYLCGPVDSTSSTVKLTTWTFGSQFSLNANCDNAVTIATTVPREDIAKLQSDINGLTSALSGKADKTATPTTTAVTANTNAIAGLTTTVGTKADKTALDTTNGKVTANTNSIADLTTKINTLQQNQTAVTATSTAVADNTKAINDVKTAVDDVKTAVDTTKTDVANNTKAINDVKAGVATTNTNVANNTKAINDVKTAVATTNTNVANNTKAINDVKTGLARTNEQVSTLTTTVANNTQQIEQLNETVNVGYNNLNSRINSVSKGLSSGIASAVALSSMPDTDNPGEAMIAVGSGFYNGEHAVAVGISGSTEKGNVSYKVGGTWTTGGDGSIGAGVGYKFK